MDTNTISILVYTHSEYSFMWKAFIPLLEKYARNIKIHWLYDNSADVEVINKEVPPNWIKHTYDENLIWTKRVLNVLNEIQDEYILFLHEDWLPISDIKIEILNEMTHFMKNQNCNFLLSYAHISTTSRQEGIPTSNDNYFFYAENNHVFQPAIWNKNVFIEFCSTLNKSKNHNEDGDCLNFMGNKNCWSVQNLSTVTSLRTKNSLFFPHMHALSQGLWNFTKYPSLKTFLEEFGIDTNTRGIHSWWELDTQ
jgi:hypothetical protein